MNRSFIVVLVGFVLGALGLLIFATQSGASLVLDPSTLLTSHRTLERVRVAGRVAEEALTYQTEPEIVLRFSIHDPGKDSGQTLSVVYRGLKPDMFAPGRDVIVDGQYENGELRASSLLTQCPSKYEPPDPSQGIPPQPSDL